MSQRMFLLILALALLPYLTKEVLEALAPMISKLAGM